MLIPIAVHVNEWTTLPPPICASDIRRLNESAAILRYKFADKDLRGLEPVIQVWFNCDCVFTQDVTDGYAWLANKVYRSPKMRIALLDGTKCMYSDDLEWPQPDGIKEPL